MTRLSAPLLLLAATILITGCSGADGGGSSGPPLRQSVTMYNELLRWGTPMGALEYVAQDARDPFVAAVQSGMAKGRILEVEVQAVRRDPKEQQAEVFVSFLWTPGDSISTVTSVQKQIWKRTKKIWQIHEATPMGDGPTIFTW